MLLYLTYPCTISSFQRTNGGDTGLLYVSVNNLTSNPQRMRSDTLLGMVVHYHAVPEALKTD